MTEVVYTYDMTFPLLDARSFIRLRGYIRARLNSCSCLSRYPHNIFAPLPVRFQSIAMKWIFLVAAIASLANAASLSQQEAKPAGVDNSVGDDGASDGHGPDVGGSESIGKGSGAGCSKYSECARWISPVSRSTARPGRHLLRCCV